MSIEQEKNEVRLRFNDNEEVHTWASARSARTQKGAPGREGRHGGDWESKTMNNAVCYNSLPPGSDNTDQEMADIRKQEIAGPMGNGSQFTVDLSPQSVRDGFSRKHMSATDEYQSGERRSRFYDEASVDGKVGYLEKNNLLDRN
ncbi:MAG TPA: hypothetical protein VGO37_06070 [Steroidobacteraceae bacterium]|jgi:hypothetical protein|nr:hypothetical protein [Steroidobacteraceae bacterium]